MRVAESQSAMECPGCKASISDDSHFCRLCGTQITPISGPEDTARHFHPGRDLAKGSRFRGRYVISEELGRGGMGIVYKAEDVKLKRNVALKFLPPEYTRDAEAKERFIHEAQAASSLEHPNICTIHEIEETEDGQMYISMGCYDGDTLQKIIREGPVDIGDAVDLGIQVTQGLQEAHEKGIVHRDIKPSNIIVTRKGRAKVMDFGLAKLTGQTRITKAGTAMGTVSYMSPEQARGEDVDSRTDVWSLGVVLYEMVTGSLPFKGDYDQAVIYSILNEDPKPVSELNPKIPHGFDQIIAKCLEKDSTSRYQSAAELENDLGRWREESGLGRASRYGAGRSARAASRPLVRIGVPTAGVAIVLLLLFLIPGSRRTIREWLGIGPPREMKVALLPCATDQLTGDHRALCDGLMLTLTNHIAEMPGLPGTVSIVPADEVRELKSVTPSDARVNHAANTVLRGAFIWAGDNLEINIERNDVSLEVEDGRESEIIKLRGSVDLSDPLENLATWQDTLVLKVLGLLDLRLNPANIKTMSEEHSSIPSAFSHFLEGQGYLQPYLVDQDVDSAIESFRIAVENDPSYELAYLGLGNAYLWKYWQTKDSQWAALATESARRSLEIDDRSVKAHLLLGRVARNTGDYDSAIEALNEALALDSKSVAAYEDLAAVYREKGDLDKAEQAALAGVRVDSASYDANFELGYAYYRQGRYTDAIEPFTRLTKIRPNEARWYNYLGGIYFNQDKWADAEKMFAKCLEIDSTAMVIANLGTLYFFEGRFMDAARMYKKALALSGDDYKILAQLAESQYWSIDDRDASIQNFRKAAEMAEEDLKTDPLNTVTLSDLASYYNKLGDDARAHEFLEKTISLEPDDIDVIMHIAETYEMLGERDKALGYISKAFKMGAPHSRVNRYPGFNQLRVDPRYKELIKG